MSLGHYDALIKRMARAFGRRRKIMATAIGKAGLEIAGGGEGGSSFWIKAPEGIDTEVLAARLLERGVLIEPGAVFFPEPDPSRRYFRLAYSSIPEDRIAEGIALIAAEIAVG